MANKLPRWTAVLWTIGVVVYGGGNASGSNLVILIGVVVLAVGFAGAGVKLWSEKETLAT
jgi:hypothetical protein